MAVVSLFPVHVYYILFLHHSLRQASALTGLYEQIVLLASVLNIYTCWKFN